MTMSPTSTGACPYPFKRPSALEQPQELRTIRRDPVVPVTLPSGDRALLITRYADLRSVLSDERVSRDLTRPGTARMTKDNVMFQDPHISPDPPEHTRMRRLITKAFTPRRVEELRPRTEKVVAGLLDAMEAGPRPGDLNEALAFPLTIRMTCELLGVPIEDQDRFRAWTDHFLSVSRFTGEEIGRARGELIAYVQELVAAKRAEPGDDLISAMIAVQDDDTSGLSEYELVYWTMLLLIAGYETTAGQLGSSMVMMLDRPQDMARLRDRPELVPPAVEELLRLQVMGSSLSMLRYVKEDIEVGGVLIPAGSSIIPSIESANMDPEVFPSPETFDITRKDNHHVTFSTGIHFCAGAALARMELQVALDAVVRRFPGLRLAVPVEELPRNEGALIQNFLRIPVEW
ncbi:cytochrome P450 [Streptomyces roseoverticillatus]|uniref:cytochrome P450 n=1 Tax=Streptomyces roseoverticillatus TaxID=66429 RepID=UPI000693251F|nr:cytochrome P450 [Streptomyces roseoverticillatus]